MSNYRKYNWPELFQEFDASGLSQVEFCKQHSLNPKYFNLKLSKRNTSEGSAFTKVAVHSEPISPQGIILEVGHCKIHCPSSMPVPSFVSLVKALA